MVCTLTSSRISADSPKIWDNVYGGNGVSVQPYAHPSQLLKVLKHLIYVYNGCEVAV